MRGPYLYARDVRLLNPASKQLLADPRTQLAKASIKSYSHCWEQLQRRHPDYRIEEFTEEVLIEFFTVDERGKPRVIGQEGWRERTVVSKISAVRCLFTWAYKRGLVKSDPSVNLWDYGPARGQRDRTYRRHNWMTKAQVDRLIACFPEDEMGLRDRTIIQTLAGTGLREFELTALKWGDLDLEGWTPTVYVNRGKGNKYREVSPTKRTADALLLWREASGRALGRPVTATDAVFPRGASGFDVVNQSKRGDRRLWWDHRASLGEKGVTGVVTRAGEAIGVPTLRPHDLRRTFAGLMEEAGTPVQEISKALGHSSVDTTIRYLAASPAKRAAVMAGADW